MNWRQFAIRACSVAVGVILISFLWQKTDGEFLKLVQKVNWITIFIIIFSYSIVVFFDVIRLLFVFHPNSKSLTSTSIRGVIAAPSLNMLFPGRAGDLNALISSRSSDWPLGQRTRNLVLLRLTDLGTLAILTVILGSVFFDYWVTLIVMIVTLIAGFFVWASLPKIIEKFARVLNIPIGQTKPDEDSVVLQRFIASSSFSLVFWFVQGVFTWYLLYLLGIGEIGILATIGAISVANLSKLIPITPGGVGIYENILAYIFHTVGDMSAEVAATAALADGLSRYMLTGILPWLGVIIVPQGKGLTGSEE